MASVELELLTNNQKIAQSLCSQALQKFPESGLIWALTIKLEPFATRKTKGTDALKKVENSPWIFIELAKVFWVDQKFDKVEKFLQQAVSLDKDNGDSWAWLLKLFIQLGQQDKLNETISNFTKADPCHGILWPKEFKKVENWSKPKSSVIIELTNKLII